MDLAHRRAAIACALNRSRHDMQLYYWRSREGNFGDDLNLWLWPALMPDAWSQEDGVVFLGVGSILNNRVPEGRLRVVFGSGVGYHDLPPDYRSPNWRIYCVRGPLSARVLDLSNELAICDSAVLLRTVLRPAAVDPAPVVFVPHWSSVLVGQWREACQLAGIGFIDPRSDSRSVVTSLATARLVIAESMHAAIIADAFRVPWVPALASPTISSFKWQDWCQSLGIDYAPTPLPPSGLREWVEHRCLPPEERHVMPELVRGRSANGLTNGQLLDHYRKSVGAARHASQVQRSRFARLLPRAMRRAANSAVGRFPGSQLDRLLCERAAEALMKLAGQPGILSPDRAMEHATERLLGRLETLKRDFAAGFPT
jgi:succinoglycan biosynthesis protein ExoV